MDWEAETRIVGAPIYLGVLGKHENITKAQIHESILHPLMSVLGRLPDKLLVPSEGTSSAYISLWAERASVDTQCVEADWRRFQRKAGILRDSRIQKESTHLLVFVGPRSKAYELTGIREAKKGKHVFLVDYASLELTELVVED